MKKILFLSWKDIKHPEVWWAEVVLWNYIKRLKDKWYDITWVWSNFEGWQKEEIIDSIKIIRIWSINNIYFKFYKYYKKHLKWEFDLIIDEAGWMPLFSPLFEKKVPIIFLIHHISDIEWDFKYIFPLNKIWKFIYRKIIKIYRRKYTITVSKSTKDELVDKYGFDKNKVFEIENALDIDTNHNININKKNNEILFFGRLMPMKRVEHAILAFKYFISKSESKYKLNIIWPTWDNNYFNSLKKLVKKLNIEKCVIFNRWLKLEDRYKISKNKVMLFPSYKEWYWLVVLEANVYWIPAIWYDVWWVKDSIKEGINWYKIKNHDFEAMWEKLYNILENKEKYNKLVKSSYNHVKNHNTWWENTNKFEKIIKKLTKNDRST